MKKSTLLSFLLVFLTLLPLSAQTDHLLPRPKKAHPDCSCPPFVLNGEVYLGGYKSKRIEKAINFYLHQECSTNPKAPEIYLAVGQDLKETYDYPLAGYPNEAYYLQVGHNRIAISAPTEVGVLRALQSLSLMAHFESEKRLSIKSTELTDYPAFKLRGWMQDVGRSFLSFEELKKEIQLFSYFKVNTFHWHLTENQAWRFEVKAYPQLTAAASMTRFAGKYYTQEQCRELDELAYNLGINIIPEIDMPGHAEAFERAMGHDMQSPKGMENLKVILSEVAECFPHAPYIHIGADEKQITNAQFLPTMIDYVHGLGKKVIVWNPIRGLNINKNLGIDMTQMWSTAGKKVAGVPNIDCRYNYTNHFDVFADLVGIYKSNIYYQQRGDAEVAGEISAAWNDRKLATEEDIILENNVYANVIASAARAWEGGGKQYIEKGGTTLPVSGEEYEDFKDFERRFLYHKNGLLKKEPIPYVEQTNVHWYITEPFPNKGNINATFPPETEGTKKEYNYEGKSYGVGYATGAGIYLRHTWGNIVPAYYKQPKENHTAYAWTYVYADEPLEAGLNVEFQNYGRSEKDWGPDAGKWDRKGSRIWLNGEEIMPPTWTNKSHNVTNETLLGNENFTKRRPLKVQLKKGWNKIFLKLPFINRSYNHVRLNKWMFTCFLTSLDGKEALKDVIYSPSKNEDVFVDQLEATILNAEKEMNEVVGDEIGFYSPLLAKGLRGMIGKIRPTLNEVLPANVRKEQMRGLLNALDEWHKALEKEKVNLPIASEKPTFYYYRLFTADRDNKLLTSNGRGKELTGTNNDNEASQWYFVLRQDGAYDIVNRKDHSFVYPYAADNSPLMTSGERPNRGWRLITAQKFGTFAIVSENVQLNQTKAHLNWKIYNWGKGKQLTDSGCQYTIRFAGKTTGIEEIQKDKQTLRMYNLQGKQVKSLEKGIFIVDGKKTMH